MGKKSVSWALALFVFAALSSAPARALSFGLNDLSVLVPLPHGETELGQMLSPASAGPAGALLPPPLLQKLPPLVIGGGDPREAKAQLRVVGIRFDPCFREGPEACRRQIRLVLQPIGPFRRAYFTTDAAVHLFYEFSEETWARLVADWSRTAVGSPADALSVHPRLATEGLSGPHWEKLRTLVLSYCGERSLTRVTLAAVNLFGTQWTFIGYSVAPGPRLVNMPVPRLTTAGQTFFGDLGDLREFFGDVMPLPAGESTLPKLWKSSVGARNTISEAELRIATERAMSFENPRKFNPGNLDCVSCHLAQNTRLWARRNFPAWPWNEMVGREGEASRYNPAVETEGEGLTNRVRSFGYFVDEPVIVKRVVTETAIAAELMGAFVDAKKKLH